MEEAQDPSNETEIQSARLRFERHFGEVVLHPETSVDNESIDQDLAREYDSRGVNS